MLLPKSSMKQRSLCGASSVVVDGDGDDDQVCVFRVYAIRTLVWICACMRVA